ncbi:MAG TPA: hypothetical protein EYM37_14140 [Methylophaga aminisulfidivorans]|uniref:hypothetical protein n=1 Tax=Methylophaga TaxID=40222 RepID=UPI001756937D|nr:MULTISPECIES: hypothetical protein [Methylophaga]WVI83662.1 hypothetical protein VSX76_01030 [Methylophaga thalassica]HIC46417.1 hypothetical protein [Methylophaga sp.]HIM41056.1 hypothetical protein [Methylophaga aminisulfidivorans]
MFDFIQNMSVSPMTGAWYYLIAGIVLFDDMKRIRWYSMSLLWLTLGSFDRGFLIETSMLGFTFMLSECFFNTYYQHEKAKKIAKKINNKN